MNQSLVTQEYIDHFTKIPSMYASCANDLHHPETTRVLAGWGDIEKNTLSFAVDKTASERFLNFVSSESRISLVSVTLSDYLTYQYKGKIISIKSSNDEDLEKVNTYVHEFCRLVAYVGIDSDRYRVGFAGTSYAIITFELDSVFDQTPRIGAGALLSSNQ
jgi:hypothetical protein